MYCPNCLSTGFTAEQFRSISANNRVRSIIIPLMQIVARNVLLAHYREYGEKCICMSCGHEWFAKRFALNERHRDLIADFLEGYSQIRVAGIHGTFLLVSASQLTFHLPGRKTRTIAFDELAVVDHRASSGAFWGRLTLRDGAHRKQRLPKTLDAARKDQFTILYEPECLDAYRRLYTALKEIAEENIKAGLH